MIMYHIELLIIKLIYLINEFDPFKIKYINVVDHTDIFFGMHLTLFNLNSKY